LQGVRRGTPFSSIVLADGADETGNVKGVRKVSKVYFIPRSGSRIRLEFINLNRDLYREKEAFIQDLQYVISKDT
jgi:hypothetical protein